MKTFGRLLMVPVFALALASCGGMEKAPAQVALTAAQASFDAMKDGAMKVMPTETQALGDSITAAKASFDAGDYKGSMATAKAVPDEVKALSDQVEAKTAEMKTQWAAMSAEMPAMMEKVEAAANKMKHPPTGMDAAAWDAMKASVTNAGQTWKDAAAAYDSGDYATAMSKAEDCKKVCTDAMTAMKMPMPAAK